MSPKLRILIGAAPEGPWSILADCLAAAGVEIRVAPSDVAALTFPENWFPDALITLPAAYQQARFDQLDLDRWIGAEDAELTTRFQLAQAVAQRLEDGQSVCVVHLVDAFGMPGAFGTGGAMIASHATAGLSRGIALDLKSRVRSNVVALAPTKADIEALVSLVRHFCGERGNTISGQVASISANRVQLFAQSRPVRVAHSDGPWSEDALAEQVRDWADDLPGLSRGANA
ncbi:Rossmann-fold NAD(P)-binding domain-containing protein [Devosia sp. A449]